MVYIGIDIAKRFHVLSAVDEDGRTVVESFRFANTDAGFKKLLERLRKAGANPDCSMAGMEATGHYWVALFDFMGSHGYEAAVINPIQTDAFRDVWTVRKVKTDALDAAMIADLVRYKRYEPSALGDEATGELCSLARYRMSLVERSTMLKNRATAILDRVFPELDGLFSGSFGPTQRALLERCATPGQVLATDVRTLERILREASGGNCGRKKAEQLKAAARRSVGVGFGSGTLAFELRLLMEELDFIRGQIDEVESELARLLDQTSGRWLLTVPGIGLALAATIAGEIGDPNRFDGPHQLMAFAGMDPTKSESGETVASDGSMSKRGSGALRWAFMQAADCARRYDPYFGDYYAKKRGVDKKHHYVALSGVARKLMGVCLALMKEGRPYEPAPPKHHRPGHLQEAAE
jgi:transposase